MADQAANRRGILATSFACVLWTANDTCGKVASETFPTGEMMAVRGVFAIVIAIVLVVVTGHARMLWRQAGSVMRPMVLLRGALDGAVVLTFLKALPHMQLADITAISQATPIIMTVIAAAFGLERIGVRRAAAVLVGFAGVLLVVKPSASGLSIYGLIAICSSAIVAVRDLLTRYIDPAIPSPMIALVTAVVGGLAGFGLGLTEEWRSVVTPPTLLLVLSGCLVTGGNLAIVIAYREADAGIIAPFRYVSILVALVLGLIVFGALPDAISVVGIVLIMGSGIYTIHRERVRRLQAAAAPNAAEEKLASRRSLA